MKRHRPRPARFGKSQAEQIRSEQRSGKSLRELAKKHQAGIATIHSIVNRRGPYRET